MAAAIEDGARGQLLEMLALPSPRSLRPRAVRRESIRSDDAIQWERIELDTVDGDTIPCLVLTPEQHDGIDVIAVHQHAGDFSVGTSTASSFAAARIAHDPAWSVPGPAAAGDVPLAAAAVRQLVLVAAGRERRRASAQYV